MEADGLLAGIETFAAGVRVPFVADVGSGVISAVAGVYAGNKLLVGCNACTADGTGVVEAVVETCKVEGASAVYNGGMAGVLICTADGAGRE